ncbi:GNAT family protein [Clostridium sp.]|jgi:ribosomal-protein-alanine N-acetyltransferase|uniref:GNAT family N-acetyltransferase n=1 Tax=Clostridium sp. TaxID=1506 RepID=UPI00258F32EB|nr:GNAT family protein [Clostridium sp.]MDF2504092.1 N-acetyltransferase [Clostridium sp.]
MNHKGTILIETDRLILRKFKQSDVNDMFKNWGSDAKVTEFLSWPTHKNIKDSEDIINQWISEYEDNSVYNWVIELKNISEAIGNISVVKLENVNDACEIGYCVSSKHWNKGITTEAFKAIIKYLFDEIRVNRICAKHDINNVASGKVMQKCGMVYEGTLREVQIRNNKFCSLAVYSILRKEWLNNINSPCV